jgi:hypothetical protein
MSTKTTYAQSATSPDQSTLAERLLALADMLYEGGRGSIVIVDQDPGEVNLARLALGLALRNRPKGFILRAIVENMDQETLMREMY